MQRGKGGDIYAIGVVGLPLVKIGFTRQSVETRLIALMSETELPLRVIGVVHINCDVYEIERRIHTALRESKYHGEWFEISLDATSLQDLVDKVLVEKGEEILQRLDHEITSNLGDDIKAIRKAHMLTQLAMAELLNCHPNYLARLERSGTSKEAITGSDKIMERLNKYFSRDIKKKRRKIDTSHSNALAEK